MNSKSNRCGPLTQSAECCADNAKVVSSGLTWTIILFFRILHVICYFEDDYLHALLYHFIMHTGNC